MNVVAEESEIGQAGNIWPAGTGMIYLGMSPWEGMWKNRHQLMSRFARQMPVLYVEPWYRFRRLRRELLSEPARVLKSKKAIVQRISSNLYVFNSRPSLPVSGSRVLGGITRNRWIKSIRRAANEIGMKRIILWISLPEMHFTVDRLGESLSIYHVVDEYGGYTSQDQARRKALRIKEQKLLDSVDLTIVVSPELAESKSAAGRSLAIVENAVDFQAFRDAADVGIVPAEFADIARPCLGYCGLIGKRLDLDLIDYLAQFRSDWSIVLVGKVDDRGCEAKIRALRQRKNVHFLGQQDVGQVPYYISNFDIGLLPYELNLETRNISPLKLYEYLAAGKPVVSTDIPAARRHASVVSIGDDYKNFAKLSDDMANVRLVEQDSSLLIDYAASNTWEKRVDQISKLLLERMSRQRH